MTFGTALALLGGQISIIMSVLSVLMGWYSKFQYERSLIKYLYTETANGQNDSNPINLKQRVQQLIPFRYNVSEFMCGNLLYWVTCCNCCCPALVRKKRLQKYEYARKRMQEECDLVEIIKRIRVLSMLTNALFAKRKTVFVGFAEKFFIKVNKKGELIDDDKSKDALTAEQLQQLLLDFNP